VEVPSGDTSVLYGVGAQLGGDQGQRLVDAAVVGVAPGVQTLRDEEPGEAGGTRGRGETMANSVRGTGPEATSRCRWGEGLCMPSAWRRRPACHQQRRLYGSALYMGRGAGVGLEREVSTLRTGNAVVRS
jgi:hypothetical protein